MMNKTHFLTATIIFFASICTAQSGQIVKEYLGVDGPILLDNQSFNLAWSSHPSTAYYKQEYIAPGDEPEKFKKMITLEALVGNAKASDLAKAKVDELKQLKTTHPLVNYEMFQKNGKIIIDFLVSENTANGKISILERNVYRYRNFKDANGKTGVLLFAVSERAYGYEADAFLSSLQKNKTILTNTIAEFAIPIIIIKN